ncbi:MAG: alanine/glycine:cation symporter family protein [Halieaceae bacterium]|jgi:AGCS family alanine or glycine:cation symporter|nr:alanine/glycine:cation symporter family protein [Halieaceae bacterium]
MTLKSLTAQFEALVWGPWLVVLLLGGGLFFLFYSRGIPYRHLPHGFAILLGRYDRDDAPGELTHAQALAAALSGTLGLGNIAGVALAIAAGGPGAVFWMWMSALIGVATKFFTCTLGVMYRGEDSLGRLQGGPMYVIREALPKRYYPLAILFAVAGLIGTLPMFQVNQLSALTVEVLFPEQAPAWGQPLVGVALALLVGGVIFGGLQRVAAVAVAVLPTMVVVYMVMTLWVIINHITEVPAMLWLIVSDAFTAKAVGGGVLGMILVGVSRGAFSNEAGVGTEVMAHGAAKTREPVREGLVAMLGPVVDTLLVCTCTAVVILLTGAWQNPGEVSGITMTAAAFYAELGIIGPVALGFVTLSLSTTTMFTTWYYGAKCFGFLFGAHIQHWFRWFFVANVIFGASVSVDVVFSLISGSYGLMAIPTMLSTLLLAPRVMTAARDYFDRFDP